MVASSSTKMDRGDHTEVIEIDYDSKVISYEDLLELFWNNHEYAARLNGYLVGVGKEDDYSKDVVKLGLSDKIASYVQRHLKENEGGNLYC
ncbi:hypothetical protein NQ314_002271 [Rhamnusium bicolor]|uniref:peptide-methionine (S)-S-oxide reductase n=1 Tax=Rhamnusium bicolor TaxID=1586634 RepID=A0AAV8ZTF2_9CUCU|nr:hypothetical protein NQ314_002271 [Rhamnusium bicolor]